MKPTRNLQILGISIIIQLLSSSWLFGAPTPIVVDDYTDLNQTTGGLYPAPIDLRGALNHINQNPVADGYTITFAASGQTITLGAMLPLLNFQNSDLSQPLTIDGGSGTTIDGASTYRGFFARQGSVSLKNLTVQNVFANGGNGGSSGGGGGMGAGAGIFIDGALVTLSNVTISTAQATGGNGGSSSSSLAGGGGGGLELVLEGMAAMPSLADWSISPGEAED